MYSEDDGDSEKDLFPDDEKRIYVRLSDRVIIHNTPEQIRIYVNYVLWRTIEPLDERGLAIACAELGRRKLVPITKLAEHFRISRPTIYKWMAKLEATYVPSDHRPDPRELGDLGVSNRMLHFVREHPEIPDEEMVELLWQRFHRPMDRFGIRRLRALIAEQQSRRKPPEPDGPQQEGGLFEAGVDVSVSATEEPDAEDEPSSAAAEGDAETEEPGVKDAAVGAEAGEPPAGVARLVPTFLAQPRQTLCAGLCLTLPFLSHVGLGQWAAEHRLAGEHRVSTISRLLGFVGLSLLGIAAPEGVKRTWRRDLAPFVGAPGLMSDRTLRSTAHALGQEAESLVLAMGGQLARTQVTEEHPLVYVDGHFLPYSGKHRVAKGYSTLRRQALPGHMATYMDLRVGNTARPLLFHVGAGDDPFRARILFLEEQFQAATGKTPLLVFDRGAVGWEMFDRLLSAKVPFVSYAPPSVADRIPVEAQFEPEKVIRNGSERTLLTCSWLQERRQGTLRLHAFRSPDGKGDTIAVAETLPEALPTAQVLQTLWSRWSIENSFKLYPAFGLNHFGVHRLLSMEELLHTVDPKEQVANPKVRSLKQRLGVLRRELLDLEDRYGTETADDLIVGLNPDAPATARARWEEIVTEVTALTDELRPEPARLPRGDLLRRDGREGFDYGPKMLQDALRVLALNGEHALRDTIHEALPDPRHERPLARLLLHSPGAYAVRENTLLVTLRRPDTTRYADAGRYLLEHLNALNAPHPALPQLTLHFNFGDL